MKINSDQKTDIWTEVPLEDKEAELIIKYLLVQRLKEQIMTEEILDRSSKIIMIMISIIILISCLVLLEVVGVLW